jgi:hypothetical protein
MRIVLLVASVAFSIVAYAAPFQNLSFEEAKIGTLIPVPAFGFDYEGPTTDLLPGWQLFFGSQPVISLGFNLSADPLLESRVSMVSSEGPYGFQGDPIEGKYSLFFWPDLVPFSLVQMGEIPAEAQKLEFTFRQLPFAVSINGLNLSPSIQNPAVSPTGDKTFVDISQFAGQTVELKITTSAAAFGISGFHEIDAIAFVVPEPSVFTLVALGSGCCLCLAIWRRWAGK